MPIPSVEEILEQRAVTTQTADTTYSLLLDQQADHFVSLVVEIGGMVNDAQKMRIQGPGYRISTMDAAEGQMVGGLSELQVVDESNEFSVEYGGRQIHPQPFDLAYRYSRREDQLNIEGPQHERTVDEMVRTVLNNEFERICLMSDTGGSNPADYAPGNMTTIDGWWVKGNEGHIYDHAGDYISPELFKQLYLHIPYKWRNQPARKADMRFYVNDAVVIHYRDVLSKANTALGSLMLTEENTLTYAGVTIQDNAYLGLDMPGLIGQSGSQHQFTGAILVERANLVFGYGPQMKVSVAPDPRSGKFIWYYWVGYIDVQYQRIDAVAKGVNILPATDPSLPVFA
jgi:hypothetical protein